MTLIRHNTDKTSFAVFSHCEKYRYVLTRNFGQGKGTLLFIGLNPSTADEFVNDPTIERVERRARAMGFAKMVVCNIFAWRDTNPAGMKAQDHPIGRDNDAAILEESERADLILCGWGNHGRHLRRGRAVESLLRLAGRTLYCLAQNKDGSPKHPLYVAYEAQPVIMPPPESRGTRHAA